MPTGYTLNDDWQVEFPSFETGTSWQPGASPFPHLQLRPVFDDNAPRVYKFTGSSEIRFSLDMAMVNQTDSYWFGANLDLGMAQQLPRSADGFHPDFSHFHERVAGRSDWLEVSTGPFASRAGYSTPFDKSTDSDPDLRGVNAADRIVITDGLAVPGDTVDLQGFGVHDWADGTFGASYENDFYLVVSPIADPSDARLSPSFEYASFWVGTAADETHTKGAGNDLVDGRAGDDALNGGEGRDVLIGGPGEDHVKGQGDGDWLYGQAGADFIEGGSGQDWIEGGADDDWVFAGADDDTVEGGDGIDHLYGDAGRDSVSGGRGDDVVDGGDDNDWVFGGDGEDQVVGGAGNDILHANAGDDGLWGEDGDDSMFGEDGADYFNGGRGDDLMLGGAGADRMGGRDGADRIFGGADNDLLEGEAGDDRLFGGDGQDRLWGGPGDDEIQGGADDDLVIGGAGDDKLVTDGDNAFADRFVYHRALDGHDVIEGFDNHTGGAGGTHDVVDLSALFESLGGGFADGARDLDDRRAAVQIAEGDFDADGAADDARLTVDGADDFSITFVDPIQHVPIAFGIGTGTGTGDDIVVSTPT